MSSSSAIPHLANITKEQQAIDDLGWTDGICFEAYGISIGIRTNETWVLQRIPTTLPPEITLIDTPIVDLLFSLQVETTDEQLDDSNNYRIYFGSESIIRSLSIESALNHLENLLLMKIAEWAADEWLFVHAGVVGWKGQGIVVPGRSMMGKSTLVRELIRAGATYYSDELAVFDDRGWVHPYARPLAIREGNRHVRHTPSAFGSSEGLRPIPVGMVLVTGYEDNAQWQPVPLKPSLALMALLETTFAARKNPQMSLPILQKVVSSALLFETPRGEASAVVPRIFELLERRPTTTSQV